MTYECFDLSVTSQVAHLVLKRGDAMNTMTPAFWRELPHIVRELDDTSGARAIVLSSTGKHFTAGMDLAVFASGLGVPADLEIGRQREMLRRLVLHLQGAISSVANARLPVIAAIQGGCIGGGVDLVSACDCRVATRDAFFVIQETNLGMVADVGTLQRLPGELPEGIVRELAFTGRRLTAERALALGFVNELYDTPEACVAGALAMAREIAEKSPLTIAGTKEMLNYRRNHGIDDSLHYLAAWQSGMFQQEDVREAMTARMQKRTPNYAELGKKVNFG